MDNSKDSSYYWLGFGVLLGVSVSLLSSFVYSTFGNYSVRNKGMKEFSTHHEIDGIPLIVSEDVRQYREIARQCLKKTDVVIEIGCAGGVTTKVISEYCADVVGVDLSDRCIAR